MGKKKKGKSGLWAAFRSLYDTFNAAGKTKSSGLRTTRGGHKVDKKTMDDLEKELFGGK